MEQINLDPVSGVIEAGANAVEKVAGVFTTNAENDAKRSADEQMALLRSYQAEFNQRENRTLIDAIADAFNRLVRPFIVTIIVFIFVLAYINPEHFAKITIAMGSVPNGYWALLSVIIGFYFGGRMQLKSQDFEFKKTQADAVKTLIQAKGEFRKLEMDTDEPDRTVGDAAAKSGDADQARTTQSNEVITRFLNTTPETQEQELHKTIKDVASETSPLDLPYLNASY